MSTSRDVVSAAPANLGVLLRRPFQAIVDAVDGALTDAGHGVIRPSHGNVFQFIDPDGTRIGELARRAQMTKQSMAELVAHLEAHGYVERVGDPRDGRAKLVRLTDKGWDVIPIALAAIQQTTSSWRQRLGERRFDTLERALTDLNDLLTP
jgi:DNA-binding MarR family transcriptional regulator